MIAIGCGDGGHDVHGFFDSSSNEVPSWGLGDEGEDEDEEEKGGKGGNYVEFAPCREDVGYA